MARGRRLRPVAAALAQLAAQAGLADLAYRFASDHLAPTVRTLRWNHPDAHSEIVIQASAPLTTNENRPLGPSSAPRSNPN